MPPANRPASCGADSVDAAAAAAALFPPARSLSLLALLFPGTGGARPPGGVGAPRPMPPIPPIPMPSPGTGGAPPTGGPPPPPDGLLTIGADRSLVTAFLRARPLVMSPRRAPRPAPAAAGREGRPPGGGGGGGGGPPMPMPGIGGGGGGGGGISGYDYELEFVCLFVSRCFDDVGLAGWECGWYGGMSNSKVRLGSSP